MEVNTQMHSIFGRWWIPIRKWFYPIWLFFELTIRFIDYSISVYDYLIAKPGYWVPFFGKTGLQNGAVICSISTFVICTIFLTVSACFVIYKFFETDNLTATLFEVKVKRFL
ncbi:hypothetical protein SAMN05421761_1256 [Belliella pelovolcani]|uniref:Uncharacterized protein n=1 Tax=Belliella pelovolcani TaxID=529505 RepID=A0A1N7Q1L6_9BACT|nr:hypothetical protein SAMN05421761_1256 [Belliella pelovolcani]